MDLESLMPKTDNLEYNIETLDSIKYKDNQYEICGQKSDDGLSYESMIIKGILHHGDGGECDIVLHLNEYDGQILQEDETILANFKFTIDDNCNFEFKDIGKLKKRFEFEFNDKDLCLHIEQTISKYCLNHVDYFKQKVDESDDFDDNVYSLNERINPPYDKDIASIFEKELKTKYEMSFIKFMADTIPFLILDEINNVVKLTLGAITVILGLHSFINELLGDSGVGKSALDDVLFEHCIPDGYWIDFNSITEPAFISYCENNPRFFDGIIARFGDLGDPKKLERLSNILDIYKILITENKYKSEKKGKSKNNDWNENIKVYMIANSTACIYGSVAGDKSDGESDVKGQKQTRTLYATPMLHSNLELASFTDQIKTKGTYGYKDGQKAAAKMLEWQEYLKKRICQFHKQNIILVNPFRNMFNKTLKFSSVWIRDYKKFGALLQTLAFVNYERSIRIRKGDDIYLIPCIDDVKDFLKITSDNIGLRVNEKNLLLKLKDEFAFDFNQIDKSIYLDYNSQNEENKENSIEEHYQNIVDYCLCDAHRMVIRKTTNGQISFDDVDFDDLIGQNDKSFLNTSENVDALYNKYGLNDKNRRQKRNIENKINSLKKQLENLADDSDERKEIMNEIENLQSDMKPILFFTASQVKRIFKGHNAIKSVANINETLNSFVEKGFLQKLTNLSASRNENVFYVEPQILEVKKEYKITKMDKIQAIAVLKHDFEIFDDNDIQKVCKDYKVAMRDVEKYIEDNREVLY